MASVNKVILLGNLGADPEVRYTQSGQAVCSLRMATNEVWNDRDGNRQERTEWHRITVWGKTAELCGQYLSKGRQVYVEGRLQSSEYTDREGINRKGWEVVSDRVVFLSGGERGPGGGGGGGRRGGGGWGNNQGGGGWGNQGGGGQGGGGGGQGGGGGWGNQGGGGGGRGGQGGGGWGNQGGGGGRGGQSGGGGWGNQGGGGGGQSGGGGQTGGGGQSGGGGQTGGGSPAGGDFEDDPIPF